MKSLSLDMSTNCIGWSIFEDDLLIEYGKINPTIDKLEWRERIQNLVPQLHNLIKTYAPQKVYVEDVPLIKTKSMKTLVQLGSLQGIILGMCGSSDIDIEFISVNTWRKNIGLFDGTKEGKERDVLKVHSIELANSLFNLNLNCVFTKNGNYNSSKSDDDIADSVLIYASTREKYKVKEEFKGFGNKAKLK